MILQTLCGIRRLCHVLERHCLDSDNSGSDMGEERSVCGGEKQDADTDAAAALRAVLNGLDPLDDLIQQYSGLLFGPEEFKSVSTVSVSDTAKSMLRVSSAKIGSVAEDANEDLRSLWHEYRDLKNQAVRLMERMKGKYDCSVELSVDLKEGAIISVSKKSKKGFALVEADPEMELLTRQKLAGKWRWRHKVSGYVLSLTHT